MPCAALTAVEQCMCAADRKDVPSCTLPTSEVSAPGVPSLNRCDTCAGRWCSPSGCASNFPRLVSLLKNVYLNRVVLQIFWCLTPMGGAPPSTFIAPPFLLSTHT